ncbi:unnamed protein product, partial [Amoebophrya sp. A25]
KLVLRHPASNKAILTTEGQDAVLEAIHALDEYLMSLTGKSYAEMLNLSPLEPDHLELLGILQEKKNPQRVPGVPIEVLRALANRPSTGKTSAGVSTGAARVLESDNSLAKAAREHAVDIGTKAIQGHRSSRELMKQNDESHRSTASSRIDSFDM